MFAFNRRFMEYLFAFTGANFQSRLDLGYYSPPCDRDDCLYDQLFVCCGLGVLETDGFFLSVQSKTD